MNNDLIFGELSSEEFALRKYLRFKSLNFSLEMLV